MENWGIFIHFWRRVLWTTCKARMHGGQQLPFYVSVCLRGIRLSAFFIRPPSFPTVTHTLRIFKILTSTKMSLSKLRFRFKILVSNFVSAWRISQFSNHTQIQKSKFPKSKNIKIFWYFHKIRMYTEFDHSILGREMGNGIRSLYL